MRKIIFSITVFFVTLLAFAQDGSLDLSFNTDFGSTDKISNVLLQSDGKILVSGNFQNSYPDKKIIRLNSNGSLDDTFNPEFNSTDVPYMSSIQMDGKVLVVLNNSSETQGLVIRLNADGSVDNSFQTFAGANGSINVVVSTSDSKILIGGKFSTYNGNNVKSMVRLKSNGEIDLSFNYSYLDNEIHYIKPLKNEKYLVIVDNPSLFGNEIFRMNSNGTPDESFEVNRICGYIPFSLQSDEKIVLQESCIDWSFGGPPYDMLYRLNTDGRFDNTFARISFDLPSNLFWKTFSDDKILVSGIFNSYGGNSAKNIMRLNVDGQFDSSFNGGNGPNEEITHAVEQSDGKIIVAGNFTSYNGITRNHLARINNVTLSANEFKMNEITFYPNPVKDVLYLNMPNAISVNEFEIYDSLGKKVSTNTLSNNQINVAELSNGVYLLKLKTDNGVYSNKFLKN
ncbi:T9SS type A sorting domain-containing protein [Flavobacterium sp. SM15]|uniref:T9SS type A sorting domain-containing protein n=1 Tax=Flavobacterium sp. SM15 TaxID=2908005 RepID=UPI001EDB5065|nr:T9SS type A sorting domain-containing protein [Flavobacterium sp. SM15]MCG2611603.1 T9SS type A sorting domain-containing protein [Flavobacterium sp. SM15]